jgi:hypothetical protein
VEAGYDDLACATRLSRSTIRRVVDHLLGKDFMLIEQPADIYHRTSTVYRVFDYRTVLTRQREKGNTHAAKLGPGFSFVRPITVGYPSGKTMNTSTVLMSDVDTVSAPNMSTVLISDSAMEETAQRHQACRGVATLKDRKIDQTMIASTFSMFAPSVDAKAVAQLIAACRDQAPNVTTEEIAFFLKEKGNFVLRTEGIRNPTGFLLSAVPLCFVGQPFADWRKQRQQKTATPQEDTQLEDLRSAILQEIAASPKDNPWALMRANLQAHMNLHSYETWLHPLRFVQTEDNTLVLMGPSPDFVSVASKYASEFQQAFKDLELSCTQVRLVTLDQLVAERRQVAPFPPPKRISN